MKPKKFVSLLLTATMTFGIATGCALSQNINAPVGPMESISSTDDAKEKLADYYQYLGELPSNDVEKVLSNPEEYTNLEVSKATYEHLKNKSIDINDSEIQAELENIVVYSVYPIELSDEEYEQTVGTLASTLSEMQNAYYLYYPLAVGTHLCTCAEEHSINEFDKLVCPTILEALKDIQPVSIEETLNEMFMGNSAYLRIKKDMDKTGVSIDVYLNELENLYILSLTPTDIYDDKIWFELFGHLDATLDEQESLYETYIDLATKIHNILNPNDSMQLPEDLRLLRD